MLFSVSTDATPALETIFNPFYQEDPVTKLRIERNQFTFPVGWIAPIARQAPHLVYLYIPSCHLGNTDFQTICNSFPNLEELIITNTGLKSIAGIQKLKHLEVLDLRENDVSESKSLKELSSLESLRELIADFDKNHSNQYFNVDNLLKSNEKLRLLGADVLKEYFEALQLEKIKGNWPVFYNMLKTVRNMMHTGGGPEQFILDTRRKYLVWLTEFMLLDELTEEGAFICLQTLVFLTQKGRLTRDFDESVPELVLKAVLHIDNIFDLNKKGDQLMWNILQDDAFCNLESELEDELVDATIQTMMELETTDRIFLCCQKILNDRLCYMKPEQFSEICKNIKFRKRYLFLICTGYFFFSKGARRELDQCFRFLMAMAQNPVEEHLKVSSYFVRIFSQLLHALTGFVRMEVLVLHWFNELAFSLNKEVFDQYVLTVHIKPILRVHNKNVV
ncbi:hypothetical protein GCK72_023395 [Caenorhabditis remanei]|uniref:Uncharacterized protein n=1 Tax=Caenorhabditis remanei TaxID=31234 RepID=A0A6A5FWQ4_CAERE|nr:hypothetical protein GCK72_023395 [Caenorhabditis remanei]KAF1746937.1 hypothetical protein GCK72_023395 [Caenorhabditis remanei]